MDNIEYKLIPKSTRRIKYKWFNFGGGIGVQEFLILLFATGLVVIMFSLTKFIPAITTSAVIYAFALFFVTTMPSDNIKGYIYFINQIQFIFSKKRYEYNYLKRKGLYKYNKKNDLIYQKNKAIIAIEIQGLNLTILNKDKQNELITRLEKTFSFISTPFTIIKAPTTINLKENFKYLKDNIYSNKPPYDSKNMKLLNASMADQYEQLSKSDDHKKTSFYIFIRSSTNLYKYKLLKNEILNEFSNLDLSPQILEPTGIIKVLYQINTNKQIEVSTKEIKQMLNQEMKIFDIINTKFKSFKFKRSYLEIDKKSFQKTLIIREYPPVVTTSWLFPIFNISNDDVVISNFIPLQKAEAIRRLNKAIMSSEANLGDVKKYTDSIGATDLERGYKHLVDSVAGDGDILYDVSTSITIWGNNPRELNQSARDIVKRLKASNIQVSIMSGKQKEAYELSIPKSNHYHMAKYGNELTSSSIGMGWPFIRDYMNDPKGCYLGFNSSGGEMIFDNRTINNKRISHNMAIFGSTGSGKTSLIKKLIINWAMNDCKLFIFDPEREYKDLVEYLGGETIDAGGSKNHRLNPFQIYQTTDNETDHFTNHRIFLEEWFSIVIPNLSDEQKSYLNQMINTIYKKKKITNDNFNEKKSHEFPTMKDLYESLMKKKLSIKRKVEIVESQIIDSLVIKIYNFTGEGSYAGYWDGPTTFNPKKSIVNFDIHTLPSNENVKSAQLLLLMRFIESEVSQNKSSQLKKESKRFIGVIIDEAHLFINENNQIALDFVYHQIKRFRKYSAFFVISTQNISDFTKNEKIRAKTEGIIEQCLYTFIGKMNMEGLKTAGSFFKSMGGLTPEELTEISHFMQGKFIFSISGKERYFVNVDLLEYEVEAIDNIFNEEMFNLYEKELDIYETIKYNYHKDSVSKIVTSMIGLDKHESKKNKKNIKKIILKKINIFNKKNSNN